ncbi:hypothetical protein M0802_000284 [Mischocyttarus mexicanus]|nr:hypothetical protein M0802_000284 [Mischocyttarus mexicanus]
MIGAMPAVAVRHERRRQEKRLKRPSQLYLGGQWMPPLQGSPPTPSPHGHNNHLDPLPELYLCGKISGLHAVVVCLLLGAVVLVVGLVQLAPGATTTDHRLALLIAGATLLLLGIILAAVRCYVLHCVPLPADSPVATPLPPPTNEHHHQAMHLHFNLDAILSRIRILAKWRTKIKDRKKYNKNGDDDDDYDDDDDNDDDNDDDYNE